MKKIIGGGTLIILALALMSCIESTTLIRVDRDGSGTIEQKVIISNSFTELMKGIGEQTESSEEESGLPEEEQLQAKAREMGEGVRLISMEPLSTEKGEGYRAVYGFQDINKVRVNQNPGDNVPTPSMDTATTDESSAGGSSMDEPERGGAAEEFLTFKFKKGNPATLIILKPSSEEEVEGSVEEGMPEGGTSEAEEDPGMMEMLRQLYQDMKIWIAVEVEGRIVETNASYQDGSRITIMEMDFGKLLEDEQTFKRLVTAQPETLEETKELLKDYPGIKVELEDELRVRFR